ncbi:MAG TPA: YdcF family protein [Pyrinomonadaceae bacterium]|nr:YdcF family protein [Pyrinomonadaceae bacterium]
MLLVWELVAWAAASFLVTRSELASADIVVLLSGAEDYQERADHAAGLWYERRAPRILVTNDGTRGPWSDIEQRNPFFYERSVGLLEFDSVTPQDIQVLPNVVESTYDEAKAVRTYADANGVKSIIVVTSAYHSRRALWTYRRVFSDSQIRIGLSPAADEGAARRAIWWLTISGWKTVPVEYVKLIYYWIHYR